MAFGKNKQDEATTASTGGSSAAGGFGNLTAFIDQGSEFEGKLSFKDTVRIDGRFTGEISSENTLIVGESGMIEANIHSPAVVISGTVTGNVTASQKLVLHKSARLEGDVRTPCLVMEDGATLNGRLDMSKAGAPKANSSAPEHKPGANGSNGGNNGNGGHGGKHGGK